MKNNLKNNIIKNYSMCLRILNKKKLIVKFYDLTTNETGKGTEITWKTKVKGFKNISYDTSIPTEEIRRSLIDNNQYCFQFYDGSIFSYEAIIYNNKVIKSNIIFIKCYDSEKSQEDKTWQDYQFDDGCDEKLGTPIYLRIDTDEKEHKEHHSVCHLTLSNYKHCRIPLTKKISVQESLNFILNNFYNIYDAELPKISHERCITIEETKKIHLNWENITK